MSRLSQILIILTIIQIGHPQRQRITVVETIVSNILPKDHEIVYPSNSDKKQNYNAKNTFESLKNVATDFVLSESREVIKKRKPSRPLLPGELYPTISGSIAKYLLNRTRRLCETKYAEIIARIFPDDAETAADSMDLDFDGRVLAKPGEYPHMVAVGFETDNKQMDYKCGGSLISERFVLTAAHCTWDSKQAPTSVRFGDLNLMTDEHYLQTQTRRIKRIHNHPEYRNEIYYHDIALLELDREVELTPYVRPIRLWIYAELPTTIAFAMGYGSTGFAKARTNRLTDLNLTIVPNDECNEELPYMSEAPNGIVESQICAYDYILNRDTCQGDSGGPLQLNLPGKRRKNYVHYHLIGLTSYGVFCRSAYPSVYTRVSSYLDWIERVTWGAWS